MNTTASSVSPINDEQQIIAAMQACFAEQQQSYNKQPYPTAKERIANLEKLKHAIIEHQDELADAIYSDFSCRSKDETRIAEVMVTVQGINYLIKHLKSWMRPSNRHVGMLFMPSSNQVMYQPLGIVGIIVPWNYPLQLALAPLAVALAAGNHAMLKMSEFTPATNAAIKKLLDGIFSTSHVALFVGEVEASQAFSALPFDHLLFTGSTAVGRHVMAAAAKNLTPVTLELGGKSPTIIAPDADINEAANRICFGKSLNAGQTCIAPDYLLVPKGKEQAFIDAYAKAFSKMYPNIKDNDDYTAIINQRQYERLQSWLNEAKEQGATLHPINPANEDLSGTRKLALHFVTNTQDAMKIVQEELFGPIFPIIGYDSLDDAIEYINARPRPLALYLFSPDSHTQQTVLERTHAGGVSINDTLSHIAQDDMPFGGVGDSGMGHYHGKEGFITLSKAKAVHTKGRFNSGKMAYPPYGKAVHKLIYKFFIR